MRKRKLLSKEELKEVFGITDVNTAQKKREPYQFVCKNCGKDKEVDGNLVWRKFCDAKCFKEFQQEQRNIKKILAVKSKFVV